VAKSKGKYSHLIDKLPRYGVEPERRDVVQAVKDKIKSPLNAMVKNRNIEDLTTVGVDAIRMAMDSITVSAAKTPYASAYARLYAEARKLHGQLEDLVKEANLLAEAAQWVMTEQMEVEGTSSLKLTNGQPVTTYLEPYTQVKDREDFRVWCIKQGLERQMALPWMVTNALVKKMLLDGQEEPPGVTVFAKTKVRLGSE
jgi:hypothetical protein